MFSLDGETFFHYIYIYNEKIIYMNQNNIFALSTLIYFKISGNINNSKISWTFKPQWLLLGQGLERISQDEMLT
jgi:hypothetical protein